ncbi:MAG: DUF58 domain-containing protein [Bacillota bacterium]|nr:DUF58 domain-containing protein [Bacillota bacterium]
MSKIKINIFFILLTLTSIILSFLLGNIFNYISYTLIIILIFGIIYTINVSKNIEVCTKVNQDSYSVGQSGKISVTIKNYNMFPIYSLLVINEGVIVINKKYKGKSVYLPGNESVNVNCKVNFKIRGIYEFGNNKLTFHDLFYIFNIKKTFISKNSVVIYPKVIDVDLNSKMKVNLINNLKKMPHVSEDLYTIKDMRKYVPGDNISRINWKASAHHGELFVKNYENNYDEKNTIFLNMNKENFHYDLRGIQEEFLIDSCFSIVYHSLLQKMKSSIYINNKNSNVFHITNENNFNELAEYFVNNKSMGDKDFTDYINNNIKNVSKGDKVIIICLKIKSEYIDSFFKLNESGYNITLLYYSEDNDQENCIDLLQKSHIESINLFQFFNNLR